MWTLGNPGPTTNLTSSTQQWKLWQQQIPRGAHHLLPQLVTPCATSKVKKAQKRMHFLQRVKEHFFKSLLTNCISAKSGKDSREDHQVPVATYRKTLRTAAANPEPIGSWQTSPTPTTDCSPVLHLAEDLQTASSLGHQTTERRIISISSVLHNTLSMPHT